MGPPPAFRAAGYRIHERVVDAYSRLEQAAEAGLKPQQAIWKRLQAAHARLREDPLWGEVIPSSRIPLHFRQSYDARNLYCIDLKGDVRCFYTIIGRVVVFLDIVDHATYDQWFAPRGRRPTRR